MILASTVYFRKRSLQLHRGAMPAMVLLVLSVFAILLPLQVGLESRLLTRLSGLGEYVSGEQGADQSAGTRIRFMTSAIEYWSELRPSP